jgi:hypothetical protein
MLARAALARMPETAATERPLAFGTVLAMRESHKTRLHEAVIRALMREKAIHGLTEEVLAVRLGKTPEQIDRFLASPEGWTFESMIDVLTAANLRIDSVRVVGG